VKRKSFLLILFLLISLFESISRSEPVEISESSIAGILDQTLDHQKIVIFGETHNSSAEFNSVGVLFLSFLKSKGFDCLMLELDKDRFQPALTAFSKGLSYEDTVQSAWLKLIEDMGGVGIVGQFEYLLENARKLNYKIFAMDQLTQISDAKTFYRKNNAREYETYLKKVSFRSSQMATEIAQRLNSKECTRVVSVVGAEHIYLDQVEGFQDVSVSSIPKYLKQSGWDSISYRLLPLGKQLESNADVYSAIFTN